MASVHPCKHASVMKKVIERMGAAAAAEQQRALGTTSSVGASSDAGSKSGKRRWLGLRKSSAVGGKDEVKDESEAADEEGLQVDYYLVIVRLLCVFPPFLFADCPAFDLAVPQVHR